MSLDTLNNDMLWAVRNGHLDTVQNLIDRYGLSHSKAWSGGYVLLREALQNQQTEVAKILLQAGCKVNSQNIEASDTPLSFAVESNNFEVVKMLLDRFHDVNHFSDGKTPLHLAAMSGRLKIAEMMLNHGASVNSLSRYRKYTPLHYATEKGHEDLVKLFLSRGANIDATTVDGSTVLHLATIRSRGKIIKLLLEHKRSGFSARDKNNETILHLALGNRDFNIVEDILKFWSKDDDDDDRNYLRHAVSLICNWNHKSSRKIIETLFTHGYIIHPEDSNDLKFLHAAVEKGCLPIIEDLLKYGANVNSVHPCRRGYTLLHNAVNENHFEVAEILIKNGADVNAKTDDGKLAISYAIKNVNRKMVQLLLSNGADGIKNLIFDAIDSKSRKIVEMILQHDPNIDINARDKKGYTALYYCVRMACFDLRRHFGNDEECSLYFNHECKTCDDKCELVRFALNRGAEVNAQSKHGISPLHVAVQGEQAKVVEILLENNADVNSITEVEMETPLHYSVKQGHAAISQMLLDKGARVNAKQKNGKNALHVACEKRYKNIVDLLLKYEVEIDSLDNDGSSPLQCAILERSSDIVEILLDHSADVESRDKNGKTALHVALENKFSEIVEKLLVYGSNVNATCNNNCTTLEYAKIGKSRAPFCGYYDDEDDIVTILEEHVIKIRALNIYMIKENWFNVHKYDSFYDDCKYEIEKMKNYKIRDTNVSYYDLLTKGINQLAQYARNESIVETLELVDSFSYFYELPEFENYREMFPIYSKMICVNFKKGKKRASLLQSSLKSFNFLSGFSLLEILCLEVLRYLSNKDLDSLTKSGPNDDKSEMIA